MEFWIVIDGEKEGPLLDFELRSRIRAGEIDPEQKVWFVELEEWTAIGEVEVFRAEFQAPVQTEDTVEGYLAGLEEEELAREQSSVPKPPPIPVEIYLWRRFGARWFDYMAYMAVFLMGVVFFEVDLKGLQQRSFFPVVLVLPWIFLEALALHLWGTTPGKWLVGLQVRGPDSQKLGAGAALLRTVRV